MKSIILCNFSATRQLLLRTRFLGNFKNYLQAKLKLFYNKSKKDYAFYNKKNKVITNGIQKNKIKCKILNVNQSINKKYIHLIIVRPFQ